MSLNKVMLIGNLGKDPEVNTFESGVKKVSFSLATSEKYKNKEGQVVEATEWHNIVCWNKLAEIAETYLHKGKQVFIEGKIKTRSWEEDGKKRYITEIEATNFQMLGSAGEGGYSSKASGTGSSGYSNSGGYENDKTTEKTKIDPPKTDENDDLPF
ncbi:MAG: single-stranded DNA-binding protein [Sphingobacteriales bacterium]|nr:MAG: single-stranded DNA-binding protein [Sphingobacteriales bacterium]